MSISLETTGDGILSRFNTDAGSNLATAILSVEIYLVSRDMNMTVSQGPRLLQGERGSSVKHMDFKIPQCMPPGEYQLTFHELDRINEKEFYSVYSIPLIIKSRQEAGSENGANANIDTQSSECSEAPAPQAQLKDSRPSKQPFTRKGATGFEIQKGKMPLPDDKNIFVPEVQITTYTVEVGLAPIKNTTVLLSPPSSLGASIPDPVPEPEPEARPASPISEFKPPPPSEAESLIGPLEVRPAAPVQETRIPPPFSPASPVPETRIPPVQPAAPVQETRIPPPLSPASPVQEIRIPPIPPPDAKRVIPPPQVKPPAVGLEVKKEIFTPPIEKIPGPNQSGSQTLGSNSNLGSLNITIHPVVDASSIPLKNTGSPPKAEKLLPPILGSNKAKPTLPETFVENSLGEQTPVSIVDLKSQFHNQSQTARNGQPSQPAPDFLRDVADLSKVKTAITMPVSNLTQSSGPRTESFSVSEKTSESSPEEEHQGIETPVRSQTQLVFSVPLIASSCGSANDPVLYGFMKYFYFSLALSYVYNKIFHSEKMDKRNLPST